MNRPNKKQVKELLIAVNSSGNFFKFPIGNKQLSEQLADAELLKLIKWDSFNNKWVQS